MVETMEQAQAAVEAFELSPQQRRLWRLLKDGRGVPPRAVAVVQLDGAPDPARLRRAVRAMVDRHEVLRTAYRSPPGLTLPFQTVTERRFRWDGELDLSSVGVAERWAELAAVAEARRHRGVDRGTGPGLAVCLVRLGREESALILDLSVLAADRASLELMVRDLARAYGGADARSGEDGEPIQYIDFADWQNELLAAEESREAREFWERAAPADLPLARPRLKSPGDRGSSFAPRRCPGCLDRQLLERFESLCVREDASLATGLLVLWQELARRLAGGEPAVIGAAFAGRKFRELDQAIGVFTRHLPLPPPDPGLDLRHALRATGRAEAAAADWQEGFDPAAEGVPPVSPFLYEVSEGVAPEPAAGLRFAVRTTLVCLEPFDLRLSVTRRQGRVTVGVDYDASTIRSSDARRVAGWLEGLVASAVGSAETPLDRLPALADGERHRLLVEAGSEASTESAGSLSALVDQQVGVAPDAVALVDGDGDCITYGELDARARRLARALHVRGIGPECRVGVSIERSPEMIVALLGVLQSGAAYVSLDPADPPVRLGRIAADAGVDLLVTSDGEGAIPHGGAHLSLAESLRDDVVGESRLPTPGGDALAYVLYTSGSTGSPKGVAMSHRAICNRLQWMNRRFPLEPEDRVLHRTPFGFDASIWEIFCPLLAGATVAVLPAEHHRDTEAVARTVRELGVTILQLVPSQLGPFLASSELGEQLALRRLFCGGEALPAGLARQAAGRLEVEVVNLYGPTETAIDATYHPCLPEELGVAEVVPIGRPLDNVRTVVLDAHGLPVPDGLPGELCVGGAGVARGYWRRPAWTADRFVPDPGPHATGRRLYRTGDLVRRRSGSGVLEFLGRLDQQVKIRGVRVEPGEVEALLCEHRRVHEAVAVVREAEDGGLRLIAYYSGPEGETAVGEAELRAFTRERLPAALVPARLVALPSLPRTPSGKLDRRDLPELGGDGPEAGTATGATMTPADPVEELLVEIWADVLGLDVVGPEDDFFALGGHSLIATQAMARVREAFRVELPLHRLFQAPTPRALGRAIAESRGGAAAAVEPIRPIDRDCDLPLSFAQQRLWFLDHHQAGSTAYSIPTSARLLGPLEPALLARALREIARRHEVLRTAFLTVDGGPALEIRRAVAPALPVVDLSSLPETRRDREARRSARDLARRPLDLADPPLFRALLFRLCGGETAEHVVVVVLHHIITDAWSGGVLLRELNALYTAYREGRRPALPDLPIQYVDFAAWQRRLLSGERLERQLAFWEHLRGAPPVLELRTDRRRPEQPSGRGAVRPLEFSESLTRSLRELTRSRNATLFMGLLAAFAVVLRHESGRDDLVVGTDVANRTRTETERLIGFFINQLALRLDLSGDPAFDELLQRVRSVALGAYDHQDVPFERVLERVAPERTLAYAPLFQVKLFLLNTPEAEDGLADLEVEPFGIDAGTARLDLVVALRETADGLRGWVSYTTDLFDARTVDRLIEAFRRVLERIVERPRVRLGVLTAELDRSDKERRGMNIEQRKSKKIKKFKRIDRAQAEVVRLDDAEVVSTEVADPEHGLPLEVRPRASGLDLVDWAKANRERLEGWLVRHGAVRFRGFGITEAETFEALADVLAPGLYDENGEHRNIGGSVFVPVFYPRDKQLLWHNENSFNASWPTKILFCCARAPDRGGETPIVDSRKVYERIDPEIRERFAERGVTYVRTYGENLGLDWREVFRTDDRSEVEERCRREGMEWVWKDGDRLQTRATRPAVLRHPSTNELSWFNQAQHWHPACLDPETRESLRALYAEEDLPRHCFYGDGSPIEDRIMAEILDAYRELEVAFPWEEGDVLLVDNVLCAHGRNPFEGDRKILVTMGEMRSYPSS